MESEKLIEIAKESNRNLDFIDDNGDRIKVIAQSEVGSILIDASFIRGIGDDKVLAICQDRIVTVNKNTWEIDRIVVDILDI